MNPYVKQQFDQVAKEYDQQRRGLIPCFDDFYGIAASWVHATAQEPRILDLGAGTGLFSAFVQQKYPQGQFTLMDLSEAMLDQAGIRFGDHPNVKRIVADYTAFPTTEPYDAIISSLSIHHLTHEAKQALFRHIFAALKDGGVFVNADQAAGPSAFFDEKYRQLWLQEIGRSGLPQAAIDASIERRKLDINATVSDQLAWLREADFSEVDCVYKHYDFAVFVAIK
ncbi:tRNA (cmo5U34)-methyltransferase [Paenibacillus phyllosphaerae]|uniref:tRNA (Cmo5U34)-methyltransferase n=1 Tax=Paenibacillus phyllosphaerae TaxID=274593 RepID=A0A7W5B459_9BACL|nr:class I SAM-dependent methyltransferase [Paenibacillus phyllosphaerae]MBB3113912.1 tRNA (cmo5U34)-methyltransferase [Paenibacillus phyllosphaerae]